MRRTKPGLCGPFLGSGNMDKYVIHGGRRLCGEVNISGAKNAAVAILPAAILADSPCRIENLPDISDVKDAAKILRELGAVVESPDPHTMVIDPRPIESHMVCTEEARGMRGSYYFIGALLGRFRRALVPMPGGCNFGVRPIDQHLKGFEALGCQHSLDNGGMISVSAPNDLFVAHIYLDVVSVGATMNTMLTAVKARGVTVIENAAREPHVVDLANFLNTMGADIRGAGTDTIKIHGVQQLRGAVYAIIPDQIEAGTYMMAAAATRGDVTVKNVTPKHLESISAKLVEMGVTVEEGDDTVRVVCDRQLRKCNVKTQPHPGFPTDMQPQITTLLTMAGGMSMVTENIYSGGRFKYVDELRNMGAQITVEGSLAVVEGVAQLKGAPVRALDLRAGVAMILAGLMASGATQVENIQFIERGYENIVEKLAGLGADIYYQSDPEPRMYRVG